MERKGHYIRTFTGRKYWPIDPRAEDICIEDVAHALSNLCRYTGHTSRFYSVGEHSLVVERLAPETMKLSALLHDAHEAYINDIAKPFKLCLPEYREVEDRNWAALAEAFGLDPNLPREIKELDAAVFRAERLQLMSNWTGPLSEADTVGEGFTPEVGFLGLRPDQAEILFLKRYQELRGFNA